MPPIPPPIRRMPVPRELTPEVAETAIETVKNALPFFTAGMPIIHHTPHGVNIDIPVMYLNVAIDRLHYDPKTESPLPKGLPGVECGEIDPVRVKDRAREILKGLRVLEAAEFRKPENCWVVPVAWRSFIVLHVRISADGKELIPDYRLMEEVMRYGV